MTPKEITTLAGHRLVPPWVMKLALDVAAAEREECAKVCEETKAPKIRDEWSAGQMTGCSSCAAAIRARDEK